MPLIFSRDRLQFIRQRPRQVHATLVLRSESYDPKRLYSVYREYSIHDENGDPVGRRREPVQDVVNGELRRARATVRGSETVDVMANETGAFLGRSLTQADARDCGFTTVYGLRTAWKARHREDFAQVVWFVMGDQRDVDSYLQWTGYGDGDYTSSPSRAIDSDAPALRPEQYAALGMRAQQRETARKSAAARALASRPVEVRMAHFEAFREELGVQLSRELRVITDRLAKAQRRAERERGIAA